ncbi:MAG TPA: CHAP domain-containing protein [Patescibacteria group bacterium]|nr:CHAP domain-containing protein [Patescibacteria group bacterium]
MILPINAKAQKVTQLKINYIDPLSPEQTLYRPDPGVVIQLQADYVAQTRAKIAAKSYAGNCVEFAKHYLGLTGRWGYGGDLLPRTYTPEINSVVIFSYGHVAVITAISNGKLILIESNYSHGRITAGRQVAIGDPTILGYYNP